MASRQEHATRSNRESYRKRYPALSTLIVARDVACVYCGSGKIETFDHVVARWFGIVDDSFTNVAGACNRCNSAKRHLSLDDWEELYSMTVGALGSFKASDLLRRVKSSKIEDYVHVLPTQRQRDFVLRQNKEILRDVARQLSAARRRDMARRRRQAQRASQEV